VTTACATRVKSRDGSREIDPFVISATSIFARIANLMKHLLWAWAAELLDVGVTAISVTGNATLMRHRTACLLLKDMS
jgi:hypothetical protein